jgi:hypothetical protein
VHRAGVDGAAGAGVGALESPTFVNGRVEDVAARAYRR